MSNNKNSSGPSIKQILLVTGLSTLGLTNSVLGSESSIQTDKSLESVGPSPVPTVEPSSVIKKSFQAIGNTPDSLKGAAKLEHNNELPKKEVAKTDFEVNSVPITTTRELLREEFKALPKEEQKYIEITPEQATMITKDCQKVRMFFRPLNEPPIASNNVKKFSLNDESKTPVSSLIKDFDQSKWVLKMPGSGSDPFDLYKFFSTFKAECPIKVKIPRPIPVQFAIRNEKTNELEGIDVYMVGYERISFENKPFVLNYDTFKAVVVSSCVGDYKAKFNKNISHEEDFNIAFNGQEILILDTDLIEKLQDYKLSSLISQYVPADTDKEKIKVINEYAKRFEEELGKVQIKPASFIKQNIEETMLQSIKSNCKYLTSQNISLDSTHTTIHEVKMDMSELRDRKKQWEEDEKRRDNIMKKMIENVNLDCIAKVTELGMCEDMEDCLSIPGMVRYCQKPIQANVDIDNKRQEL